MGSISSDKNWNCTDISSLVKLFLLPCAKTIKEELACNKNDEVKINDLILSACVFQSVCSVCRDKTVGYHVKLASNAPPG